MSRRRPRAQPRRHTTVSPPSCFASENSEIAGRRASSFSRVTSGLRPGRAAGGGGGCVRLAIIASTCSCGIVRRRRSSSSEIRRPNRSRAPSRLIGVQVAELAAWGSVRTRSAMSRVDRRRRVAVVAEEVADRLVGDVHPALAVDHVAGRLAGDELRDRRDQDRVAHLGADAGDLLEHGVEQLGPAELLEHPPRGRDHAAGKLVGVVDRVELARARRAGGPWRGRFRRSAQRPRSARRGRGGSRTRSHPGCGPCSSTSG